MKFQVGTDVVQLQLGAQPEVTIYNEGPSTVYLDDNASVRPDTGFSLAPTGQMTWKSGVKLFACTRRGITLLRTNPSGNLAVTSRGTFVIPLASNVPGTERTRAETGFADTLIYRVRRAAEGSSAMQFTWYDDYGNQLYVDSYLVWCNIANDTILTVPIRGSEVEVFVGSDASTTRYSMYASNLGVQKASWFTYGGFSVYSATAAASVIGNKSLSLTNWDHTRVPLPAWSDNLTVNYTGTTGTGGYLSIVDAAGVVYGNLMLPVGMVRLSATFRVPTWTRLYAEGQMGLAGTTNYTTFVWS